MRATVPLLGPLLVWAACSGGDTEPTYPDGLQADTGGDADTDADADSDADTDADTDTLPPHPVRVSFTGTVVTVSGTPLGLDDAVRGTPVSGSFGYDLSVADDRPTDAMRGEYDHQGGGGPFTVDVGGHTVTGSDHPVVTIELYGDTFRWVDGPQLGDPPAVDRTCSVDGDPDPGVQLGIAFTPTSGADPFTSDALPDPFPYVGLEQGTDYLLTFSVEDAAGTLLLQLDSLSQAR